MSTLFTETTEVNLLRPDDSSVAKEILSNLTFLDLRIDLLERHLEELDHFVTKNITQLNTEVDDLFGGMSGTDFNQATEDETVENVEGQLHDLQLGQQANHWNLESLADQVDKLDDRGEINQYLRSDVTSLKEQQNLQEIKQLMMSQELRRIITVQDQKVTTHTLLHVLHF